MKEYRRSLWTAAVVCSLACFAGCQHGSALPTQASQKQVVREGPAPVLTSAQTADVQISMGRSLETRGQEAQAMAVYQEALKQDPSRGDAYLRLAILHDRQGKFPEAEAMYKKALMLKPGNADIFCN